ncbi:hypothetical protein FGM00_04175 [Aggregatimonas sangjinii]|uniref:Gliding motility-associated C-terminal domain-containing protein n=1 Tax=Aggregatimonas sangjinii TaxID=2583587 RepID=A0A5B7SLC4_9FLAO|nr:gliding motility-associated C-terminal domain-containing protein [Aggregatimonas sangjinii]QCW99345.1 hypothetical protein FGM00_04175 [Aggregatimonas sangjinii]
MKSKTTRPLFRLGGGIAFILILVLSLASAQAQDCTVVTADGIQDTDIPTHQWKIELYQGYFGVQGVLTEPGYINAYNESEDHVAGSTALGTPILREEAYTDLAALPFAYADENIPISDNPFDSAVFDSRSDIGTGFDPVVANGGWQMIISRTATAANEITIGLPGSYIDDHVELFIDGVLIDDIIGFRPSLDAADVITYTTAPGEEIEIRLTNREGVGGFNLYIDSPSLDRDNNAVPDACQTDDFDLDGVPDSADLDDDNDGILDTDECAGNTSTANMTGDITDSDTGNYPLTITGSGVSGGPTAGGVFLTDVNLSTTLNGGDIYDGCEFVILSDAFDDGFQALVDGTQVLYFDQSNWDNTFGAATTEFNTGGLFDSDDSGRWTPWTGEGNPQLLLRSNGEVSLMVDTKAGVRLNALPYMDSSSAGWVLNTSFSFDCLSGVDISAGNANDNGDGQATNIIFTANVFVCPDADGDGISNGRDNDSDEDGCPDALEGSGSFNISDVDANGRFTGNVDADGIPILAAGGQATTAAVLDDTDSSACPLPPTTDNDNDGIDDDVDIDDDNDGILDTVEGTGDTDGDGIIDSLDLDSDNDGIPDILEAGSGNDMDGDGQVDYPTPGDPMSMIDTNNDGLDDGIAANPLPDLDSDNDGLVDRLDLDADNDGIADIIEAGGTDANADGQVDYATPGDPMTMVDVDQDGFIDTIDTNDNTTVGVGDGGTALPDFDNDGDLRANRLDLDSDNDGIHDVIESGGIDTDGNGSADDDDDNADNTGSDGIPTSAGGGNTPTDTGDDGTADYLNLDSDGDGCSDANEAYDSPDADGGDGGQFGTGTPAAVDGNGLVTAAAYDTGIVGEVTDATDASACVVLDTDGDGVLDTQEIADGTNPDDPCDFVIASITVEQTGDYMEADCDGDGVQNWAEIRDNTNPEDPCDFIPESVSVEPSGDYLISDCDGDGVTNGTELSDGTDPADPCDFDANSVSLEQTGAYLTADCDGDTITNGQEITDGTDPDDPCSSRGGIPPSGTPCDIIIDNDLVGPQVDAGFFRINNIEAFPNNTVRIYNRWGILVYETTGYDNGDNNFRGFSEGRATISEDKALPVGVYFYVIDFMNNGANASRSGYLYVNR